MTRIVYPDPRTVAEATAARLLVAIADALSAHDEAHVSLTGGGVGIQTLARAAASPLVDVIDWRDVHFWWGDERYLSEDDHERNENQATRAFLKRLRIPSANLHRMGSTETHATPQKAAAAYAEELARYGRPRFDVTLLGIGPDGHVASLFPGHPALHVADRDVVAVEDAPKPPPTRLSLTVPALNRSREIWFITTGEEKARALRDSMEGTPGIPAGFVRGADRTLWLVDRAAALETAGDRR